MKLSYGWLKEYVPKLPKPEKLAELLTFHVAEVESIQKVGASDWVLSMDVLPNRAHDLNSHLGVAQEIAALTNEKLKAQSVQFKEEKKKRTNDVLSVRIEDAEGCQRYIGRYMDGVTVTRSPAWLQDRLRAVGMRPINNVVDATNYSMLETGQPLHAFDADTIAKNAKRKAQSGLREIVVRKANKGEKFVTLDNQKFVLDGNELMIADEKKALAIGGIKGGKYAGVTAKTKRLILEAANFDPARIRRTSQKLGLVTDASKRFSGGLNPVLAGRAMERLVSLLQKLTGGAVYGGAVDAYPKRWPVTRILFHTAACNAILGTSLKEAEMKRTLASLGCKVTATEKKGLGFLVEVPAERLDLMEPQDLYEEVGRIHGWENIASTAPQAMLTAGSEEAIIRVTDLSRKVLQGMGYSEHRGYALMGTKEALPWRKSDYDLKELANPLTKDTMYLRPMPLPSLLRAVAENAKRRDAVRLFEIGKSFRGKPGALTEEWDIGIALYHKRETAKHEAWYEIKGALDAFLRAHGLAEASFSEADAENKKILSPLFEPATISFALAEKTMLAGIGVVTKTLMGIYGIEGTVVYSHVLLEALLKEETREREFSEILKYPSVIRDIAVIVSLGTKVEAVENLIEREGGELLWDVDIFDIFVGTAVGSENESIAFRLTFQSAERTLTDKEVNGIMKNIVAAIKKEGWEVRE